MCLSVPCDPRLAKCKSLVSYHRHVSPCSAHSLLASRACCSTKSTAPARSAGSRSCCFFTLSVTVHRAFRLAVSCLPASASSCATVVPRETSIRAKNEPSQIWSRHNGGMRASRGGGSREPSAASCIVSCTSKPLGIAWPLAIGCHS